MQPAVPLSLHPEPARLLTGRRALVTGGSTGTGPRCILMMSSVHEVVPWKRFSHYCASKGGLKLFAQSNRA